MPEVKFIGWVPGFKKVSFSRMLRENTELSLGGAKLITDKILENEVVTMSFESIEVANSIADKARALGVLCTVDE